jgi:hypothetical protein
MSFVATTADVVVEATVFVPAFVFFEAPRTLAYAMTEPAMNKMAAITTSMSVCLFTESFPPLATGEQRRPDMRCPPLVPVARYDGERSTVHRHFGSFST